MNRESPGAARLRIALLIVGGVTAAVIAALAWRGVVVVRRAFIGQIDSPGLETISRLTGVWFPDGSRLMGSQRVCHGEAVVLCARVHFDRADLKEFLAALPESRGRHSRLVRDSAMRPWQAWWNPDSVRDLLKAGWEVGGRSAGGLLVSVDHPTDAMVFVVWRE